MKYVIDPFLFSFKDNMNKKEVIKYVEELSLFDKWWKCHKDEMYTISEMDDLLYNNDFYPAVEKLAPLLEQYDTDYEYKDISKMMLHYIEQTNYLDDIVDSELLDKKSVELDSSVKKILSKRPEDFQESFLNIVWLLTRNKIVDSSNEIEEFAVFAKDISQDVHANIKYEKYDEKIDKDKIVDCCANVTIICHSSLNSFTHHALTPFYMWRYSNSRDDLDFGLRCRVLQEDQNDSIEDVNHNYTILLQESFYDDFCKNRYSQRPSDIRSALDSMMKAVKSIRQGKEHNMRVGPGGNDDYVFHGTYAGMRKNVTTSIKLHYWRKTPYNKFAKIGEHDFFDIPWEDDENLATPTSLIWAT